MILQNIIAGSELILENSNVMREHQFPSVQHLVKLWNSASVSVKSGSILWQQFHVVYWTYIVFEIIKEIEIFLQRCQAMGYIYKIASTVWKTKGLTISIYTIEANICAP